MAFRNFSRHQQGIELLQRSLERGRLAHGYLFSGHQLEELESVARTLAMTLNCQNPIRKGGIAIDSCDECLTCRRVENNNYPDVHWVRPESRSRIITVEQIRDVMREVQLKPNEAEHKVAVIVAADRLRVEAANAFLKTLEEPPAKSVLLLLSSDPQRILDTILSRCFRLNFGGEGDPRPSEDQLSWLKTFSEVAASRPTSLLGRYRLLDVLLQKLNETREAIEKVLKARSPLEQYPDAERHVQDKWEEELKAAIEAEYRRQRQDWVALLQRWLRDVWLQSLGSRSRQPHPHEVSDRSPLAGLLGFPGLSGGAKVAEKISPEQAIANLEIIENLQRLLFTNVQEALALEVALLKLNL